MWLVISSTDGCGCALGDAAEKPLLLLEMLDRARTPETPGRARRLSCSAFFTSMAAILPRTLLAACLSVVQYERLAIRCLNFDQSSLQMGFHWSINNHF